MSTNDTPTPPAPIAEAASTPEAAEALVAKFNLPPAAPALPPEVKEAIAEALGVFFENPDDAKHAEERVLGAVARHWPRPALDVDAVLAEYVSDPKDDGTYTLSLNAEETTKLRADLMRLIPRPAPVTADARELAGRVLVSALHHPEYWEDDEKRIAAVLAPVLAALEEERERSATHEYFKEQAHKATDEWKARAEAAERERDQLRAEVERLKTCPTCQSTAIVNERDTLRAELETERRACSGAQTETLHLRAEVERLTNENTLDHARQLERELAQARNEIARREADLANCQRDVHELLRLLGEIRFATGDRGKRNQAELVAYCADLAKRAAVLEKVRAYPYIPTGVISIIERELRTNTTTP